MFVIWSTRVQFLFAAAVPAVSTRDGMAGARMPFKHYLHTYADEYDCNFQLRKARPKSSLTELQHFCGI
jgi:hypothetical protein